MSSTLETLHALRAYAVLRWDSMRYNKFSTDELVHLLTHENWMVRDLAGELLQQMSGQVLLYKLLQQIYNETLTPELQAAAVWALNPRQKDVLTILQYTASHPERAVQNKALILLGRSPFPTALNLLLQMSRSKNWMHRDTSARLLAKRSELKARHAMELLSVDADQRVAYTARNALTPVQYPPVPTDVGTLWEGFTRPDNDRWQEYGKQLAKTPDGKQQLLHHLGVA